MIQRYQATLMVWSGRDGSWSPRILGTFRTKESAVRRLYQEVRHYTRYERREDYGEVVDLKTGNWMSFALDVRYDVPTVGDLGWAP